MKQIILILIFLITSYAQSKIAFTYKRELHVMNPDGTGLKQLTDYKVPGHTPVSKNPQWTKDNKKILYIYDPEWHGGMSLYIMNSDGSNDIRLTVKPTTKANATWSPAVSPDGKYGLFVSKRKNNYEIYRTDLANKKIINLTNSDSDEDDPAYSPAGDWISFTSDKKLMKMKSDGSNRIQLFDGDYGTSAFSKDGKLLAFARISGENATLFYSKIDGSNIKQITDDAIRYTSVSWSPDNRQIVYLNRNEKITTINIDGTKKNVVRSGYDPSWSY